MGLFHKNVNQRLGKHLEEFEKFGLLPEDWMWHREKVIELEKIDSQLLKDLIELYKTHIGEKAVSEKLVNELAELKKELHLLLKKHLNESKERKGTKIVNNLIREIEYLIEKGLPLKIGVVGYSAQKFNEGRAIRYLRSAFDAIEKRYPHRVKEVVSGLTDLGIPALAYREAVRRGWKTVGIACSKAKEYKCFPCNEVIIAGSEWGDESPVFLKTIDVLVRVGGGKQSHRECAEAKSMDKEVYEFNLPSLS